MSAANICADLWIVFAVVWIIAWVRTKRTQERAALGPRLLYSVPIAAGSYLMFGDSAARGWGGAHLLPKNIAVSALAIVLTAVGIAFAIWARFYLGQNWSSVVSIKVGHQLIRTGPYAWIRHPIYFGLLLALIGTALARDKAVAVIAIPLFWLGFKIKSRLEEEFMRKTFGQEYLEYARTTGALIPKLRL
jgi:protein-S-isoprenylcysteine O-methyltransferase Ste14